MKNIIPKKILIRAVNVYKTLIITSEEFLNKPLRPHSIKVGFGQKSAFNFDKKQIRIRIEILLDGVDRTKKEIGLHGEFGLEYHLQVQNLNDFVSFENNQKNISGILMETLMGIIFSTSRGIILEKTQDTYFNGAIIPVISPKDLLETQKSLIRK